MRRVVEHLFFPAGILSPRRLVRGRGDEWLFKPTLTRLRFHQIYILDCLIDGKIRDPRLVIFDQVNNWTLTGSCRTNGTETIDQNGKGLFNIDIMPAKQCNGFN